MKRLIIMRHAKSDWDTDAPTDHARPLNKRGRREAPRVAQRLVELNWIPQYIVSSDSARTRETYELMRSAFAVAPHVEFLPMLYHAGPNDLASALAVATASPAWAFTEIRKAFVPEDLLEQHRIVATSCKEPRGFRRIHLKGGTKFAREGEVFAFEPRVIRAKRCEEVEIVLENTDSVRHAFMLPGLPHKALIDDR